MLSFGDHSAYEPLIPQSERFVPRGNEYLIATPMGFAFGPTSVHFDERVEVALRIPPETERPERLAVYEAVGDEGEWAYLGNELDAAGGRVSAAVRRLGRYALLLDVAAPEVENLTPRFGSVISERRPLLAARTLDGGSGIGQEEDVIMELNGRRLISVYDPEANRVEYRPHEDLSPGDYRLTVTVRDQCGNRASKTSDFRIE